MKHLFVPYKIALKLKEKGFNEECFGRIYANGDVEFLQPHYKNSDVIGNGVTTCAAPLYQQVIDWFREKGIRIYEVYWNNTWSVSQKMKEDEYSQHGWQYTIDEAIEEALKLI